jgi:tetratricopeptide (TPR) repeat protein
MIGHFRRTLAASAVVLLAAAPLPASAAGDDPTPSRVAQDPDYVAGKKAIEAKDWARAIELMQKVAAKDPKSADAYNWLGYAHRNKGDYDQAFRFYEQALVIDPRHRGAHEYIGEAYLKVGNLAKAEEHLARLDRICLFGCAEYSDLKAQIRAYKAGRSS